jgi:hypothetical protein
VIGILPWTAPTPAVIRGLAVVAVLSAILGALIAWGLVRSTAIDARRAAGAELDAILIEAAGSCDCGQDHLVAGQHIPAADSTDTPAACGAATEDCAHTCDTCVLTKLRA